MRKLDKEFERKLWSAADSLRGNVSSEEYMHIVIGLLFIKHMSDKYNSAMTKIEEDHPKKWKFYVDDIDTLATDYGVSFLIPKKANWNYIARFATKDEIGEIIDNAFIEIEKANQDLKGLFDKRYNRDELDKAKLGQVVSEFSNIDLEKMGEDIIGRTYEYFLGEFFKKQGQKGGEFYTPISIVNLMVKIVEPKEGTLYDPAAGTGGMLVQARKYIIEKHGHCNNLSVYGQEYENKTWKLSRINLLIHGFQNVDIHMGSRPADTFSNDLHEGKKFNYILANPPFNMKKWGWDKLQNDSRFELLGMPPKNNANYAWLSHMIYKLDQNGIGATVLANGSLSGAGKDEIKIRQNMIKNNYIEAIITLPDKLFYTTGIPSCLWVFRKNKTTNKTLMINASDFEGKMESKKLRILTKENISKITSVIHKFRKGDEVNEIGFAKSISTQELEENDYSFVPGRYVGFVEEKVDKEQLRKEIKEASEELMKLFEEFNELVPQVKDSIKKALEFEDEE